MRLFGMKKNDKPEGVPVRPSSRDFDIDDIDLPPLPDSEGRSSKELEFSNQMPKNEDLPPLPEAPKPYYNPSIPQQYEKPSYQPQSQPRLPPPQPVETPTPQYHPQVHHKTKSEDKAPVFVKVDKYREVLDILDALKKDLKQLSKSLDSLKGAKTKEDEIILGWNGLLSEIASKLDKVSSGLFEPEE